MLVLTQPQRMSQKKKKKDKTHAKVPAEAKTKRRGGWLQQKRMDHSASMSPRPRLDPAASLRPTDRPTAAPSAQRSQRRGRAPIEKRARDMRGRGGAQRRRSKKGGFGENHPNICRRSNCSLHAHVHWRFISCSSRLIVSDVLLLTQCN